MVHLQEGTIRDGHLFRERFKSEPVNDMAYFVTLLRYIHQNPVKAGIVNKVNDYEFSSWHEYENKIGEIDGNREEYDISYVMKQEPVPVFVGVRTN